MHFQSRLVIIKLFPSKQVGSGGPAWHSLSSGRKFETLLFFPFKDVCVCAVSVCQHFSLPPPFSSLYPSYYFSL